MKIKNGNINYVEFKAKDIKSIKAFYTASFGWSFTDYGPEYTAFSESGLEGGFEQSDAPVGQGALVVLYHENLESIKNQIIQAGGIVVQDIFAFPGGKRFHFTDPAGNELAVWSDQ